MELEYKPYSLEFSFDAGTSRGIMKKREIWLLELKAFPESPIIGKGEVAPLRGLSHESIDDIPDQLSKLRQQLKHSVLPSTVEEIFHFTKTLLEQYPSIRMGLEMAMIDLVNGGKQLWYHNDWTAGNSSIPINGLIWMNSADNMKGQFEEKLAQGFDCIKMKIGAIDFDQELEVLRYIRSKFSGVLRVDANGAFQTQDVLRKLELLAEYDLHSIEQPIMPRQWPAMHLVCGHSKIPVALDEELIGIWSKQQKSQLLDEIEPEYIILKPSLLGGFYETSEWIELASAKKIGWWITSALESNLGLNAIAQYTANFQPTTAQGLGTGGLFINNLPAATYIEKGQLHYGPTNS